MNARCDTFVAARFTLGSNALQEMHDISASCCCSKSRYGLFCIVRRAALGHLTVNWQL